MHPISTCLMALLLFSCEDNDHVWVFFVHVSDEQAMEVPDMWVGATNEGCVPGTTGSDGIATVEGVERDAALKLAGYTAGGYANLAFWPEEEEWTYEHVEAIAPETTRYASSPSVIGDASVEFSGVSSLFAATTSAENLRLPSGNDYRFNGYFAVTAAATITVTLDPAPSADATVWEIDTETAERTTVPAQIVGNAVTFDAPQGNHWYSIFQ